MKVLLTGSTGFLGTALLHYLAFHECTDDIYLLIRHKKNKSASYRFEEISKDFNSLNLYLIVGSNTCINNIDNIKFDTIINCSASISFTLPFEEAYKSNVSSILYLIEFAKSHNVSKFIHVSTAYVHDPTKEILREEFIDIDYTDHSNTYHFPNTYTHTKCIAEKLIEQETNTQSTITYNIIRPSIITSSYEIPFKGWYKGYSGYVGYSYLLLSGILKTLTGDPNAMVNLVPVDYVCKKIYHALKINIKKRITHAVSPFHTITQREVRDLVYRASGYYYLIFKDDQSILYNIIYYINIFVLYILSFVSRRFRNIYPIVKTLNKDFQHFTSNTYNFDTETVENYQYYYDDLALRM